MSRFMSLLIATALCCVAMSGCNSHNLSSNGGNVAATQNHTLAPQTPTASGNLQTAEPIIKIETPPDDYCYEFDSYADLAKALTDSSSDEFKSLRSEQAKYGNLHTNALNLFASGDTVLLVPEMNGEPIPLRGAEEYSRISLMTSELYGLPWIWYHCTLGEYSLRIQISYPGALKREEIGSAKTYLDILKLIAPNAPSPSNYQEYENYKTIYEKEVTLADGQVVTAMFSELKDSSKIYVMLYLDETLVCMHGESQLFSDTFWTSFDLAANEEI